MGCHFFPPGDLPDPDIKSTSSALAGGCFTTKPLGKPLREHSNYYKQTVHRNMDVNSAAEEDSEGNNEHVIRNWGKRGSLLYIAENLVELCCS